MNLSPLLSTYTDPQPDNDHVCALKSLVYCRELHMSECVNEFTIA